MNARTALEIFTQADDLHIAIIHHNAGYAVSISRGPKHRFKSLVSTKPGYEDSSHEDAVASAMAALQEVCTFSRRILQDHRNILTQIINPDGVPIDDMKNVVTQELLEQIKNKLQSCGVAKTYEMASTAN